MSKEPSKKRKRFDKKVTVNVCYDCEETECICDKLEIEEIEEEINDFKTKIHALRKKICKINGHHDYNGGICGRCNHVAIFENKTK